MKKENVEETLKRLRDLDREKEKLEFRIKDIRKGLFELLKAEEIKQFKTSVATVSYVKRVTLKYDKAEVLKIMENDERFVDIVPEHKELNKTFEDSIKRGHLNLEEVEVVEKESPMIRFNI